MPRLQSYDKHKGLITSRAQAWKTKTGMFHLDFESEGSMIFMHACRSYDSSQCKFSTYLYNHLNWGFGVFVSKNTGGEASREQGEQLADQRGDPASIFAFKDAILSMSKEARDVVALMLSGPADVLGIVGGETATQIRSKLRRHLLDLGWAHGRVWKAFREITQTVRAL